METRPTKCTPELLEKAEQYVSRPMFEVAQKEVLGARGVEIINFERASWASISGLAVHLEVHRTSLYNWADKNHASYDEKFFYIFSKLKQKQELLLEFHGLTGGYNAGFSKFLASNLTDYKERVQVESSGIEVKLNYKKEELDSDE